MTSRPHVTLRHERVLEPFTMVPNRMLNDARLALDEKGLMSWFLSLPPDWTVVPAHVRKEQNIGRDKFYRMIKRLVDAGYMDVDKVRSEDGTIIGVQYVYRAVAAEKTTIAANTDDDIETDDPDTAFQEMDESPPHPFPGKPDTAFQDTVINTDKIIIHPLPPQPEVGEPPKAAEAAKPKFEALRAKWPTENVLSAFASERSFVRLSEDNQRKAIDKAGAYLADMRAKKWRVCDLKAYIRERRWERLEAAAAVPAVRIVGGTPQAFRWLEYHRAMGEPTAFTEERWRYGQPVYRPTEWPPAIVPKSTGPPSDHLTESDIEELAKG